MGFAPLKTSKNEHGGDTAGAAPSGSPGEDAVTGPTAGVATLVGFGMDDEHVPDPVVTAGFWSSRRSHQFDWTEKTRQLGDLAPPCGTPAEPKAVARDAGEDHANPRRECPLTLRHAGCGQGRSRLDQRQTGLRAETNARNARSPVS